MVDRKHQRFHGLSDTVAELNRMREFWRAGVDPPQEGGRTHATAWIPRMDIFARDDDLVIRCELAGVARDDVELAYDHDALTIFGERTGAPDEEGTTYYVRERQYGAFRRTINLPEGTDRGNVHAVAGGRPARDRRRRRLRRAARARPHRHPRRRRWALDEGAPAGGVGAGSAGARAARGRVRRRRGRQAGVGPASGRRARAHDRHEELHRVLHRRRAVPPGAAREEHQRQAAQGHRADRGDRQGAPGRQDRRLSRVPRRGADGGGGRAGRGRQRRGDIRAGEGVLRGARPGDQQADVVRERRRDRDDAVLRPAPRPGDRRRPARAAAVHARRAARVRGSPAGPGRDAGAIRARQRGASRRSRSVSSTARSTATRSTRRTCSPRMASSRAGATRCSRTPSACSASSTWRW